MSSMPSCSPRRARWAPPIRSRPPRSNRAAISAATDGALLLGRAFQDVWTGQLVFRTPDLEKSIYLDAGRPVYATSTALEDRLCEILLREGRIDAHQRTRVARISAESGRRTGAVLVDLGLLKPGELMPALRGQHEEIHPLPHSLGRRSLPLRPSAGAGGPEGPPPAPSGDPGAGGARARLSGGPDPPALGAGRTVLAALRGPEASDLLGELSLGPGERDLLGWFDGQRSLEEVTRASGQPEEVVSAFAFVLLCFGVLHPVTPPAGRARRSFDQKVDRERILSRHAIIQDADYFQVLGIAREASAAEVARAYRRLSEEISPQRISAEVAVALAQELQVVRDVLDQAARVLTDETLRRRYREHLLPAVGRRS